MKPKAQDNTQSDSHYKSEKCAACKHTHGEHEIVSGTACKVDGCECKNFTYPVPER